MKTLAPGLQEHLDTGTTTLAWCWRLTRTDGKVFGFTNHDLTLTFDGTSFEPESGFTASEIRTDSNLSVGTQDAEGVLKSDWITEADIVDGRWDGATVERWRVNWADTTQRVLAQSGVVGQIRRGEFSFVAELRALTHIANRPVGRTFQRRCDAILGDARCGVNLEDPAFKGFGTVTTILRDRAFLASGLSGFAAGLFDLGTITWGDGVNAGRTAVVAGHAVSGVLATLTLLQAPVRAPGVGDTFTITAGCDKSLAICRDIFANAINFQGFPDIPGDETILRIASPSEGHDGHVL